MECAARGRGTSCSGPATRRCGSCGAVAYCSISHQVLHWSDHKDECKRLEQQMRRADVLHDFPFTFAQEATLQICEKQQSRCSFLAKRGLHRVGMWKYECRCGASVASSDFFRMNDNWNLSSVLCPCHDPMHPVSRWLSNWEDYYEWSRGEKGNEKWSSYQYVGRTPSVLPTASLSGTEVSVEEIRSAAAFSDYYPPSIHDPLISSPEPDPNEQAIIYQGGYAGSLSGSISNEVGRQILDEVEIRELLIDHVGHRCCWGSRPARTWKIRAVEDCNVYVGTLDTFIEERETIRETEPHRGGKFDGKDYGPELGIWELDVRSEFPLLFIPQKETRAKIPHSETIEKCSGCAGRGETSCPTCNSDQEPGFYKENRTILCPACYGRGLIAHRDGSDTICVKCSGKGNLPCVTCGSRGLIKCKTCHGGGYLLTRTVAIIRWKTLSTRKVSATSGAASVPDEVFHRARGVQLCNTQAHQCTPAFFADSFLLNKFSSEVIADRAAVPSMARVICERHAITVVPVTRVTMAHRNQSFSFYIIGLSREVYLKDYYPSRFCWGLCPCLDWLRL